jgi:glycosyltransferase involved in cell wall biosynthesis
MGLKQDLGNIIEAARLSQHRSDLKWVLMGDGSQRAELEAQGAGLPNLVFLPPCESADYPELLGAADVLLLNERASCDDMSLPSKLTSYFMSGRPVAAAVPPNGASADELARAGAPLPAPAGDPAALVALVSRLRNSPAACADYGLNARAYADANLTLRGAMAKMDAVLLA